MEVDWRIRPRPARRTTAMCGSPRGHVRAGWRLDAAAGLCLGRAEPTLAYQAPGTSSFSYATQGGAYVCVGGFVSGWARVSFTPTNGTASGSLFWNNLPYPLHNILVSAGTGIGPAMFISGTWSGLSGASGPAVADNLNVSFVNQSGTTSTPITTTNSTSASSKTLSWYFAYQNSTGTC